MPRPDRKVARRRKSLRKAPLATAGLRNNRTFRLLIVISIVVLVLLGVAIGNRGPRFGVEVRRELVQASGELQFAIMDGLPLDQIKRIAEEDRGTLDVVDRTFGTAMDQALINSRADVVEFLLESGWDPNRLVVAEGKSPCNPLGYALRYGDFQIAEILLEYGAAPEEAFWNEVRGEEICAECSSNEDQRACLSLLKESKEGRQDGSARPRASNRD